MLKRLLILLAVLLVAYGGYRVFLSFVDDEVRIRWLLDDAIAGFNAADRGDCLARVADDFEHTRPRMTRLVLSRALLGVFFRGQPGKSEFRFRVEVLPDSLQIAIKDDIHAEFRCDVRMEERQSGVFVPVWELSLVGTLVKEAGDWWLTRSEHHTQSGRPPSR